MKNLFITLLLPLPLLTQAWTPGQPVKTTSGLVTGHAAKHRPQVSEYLGIPYAQPPIGDLRFAAPVRYQGDGEVDGSKFSPDCPSLPASPQPGANYSFLLPAGAALLAGLSQAGNTQDEDCLSLNIWTKPQSGEAKKAVLVWLYGGAFRTGTTNNPSYNGEYFADEEDVVLVSLNYRLTIFGFPGLPSHPAGASQNPGLLDQRLALEWLRTNIAAFGGDPSRITLFGQSAGAASVDLYSYAWTADPIVAGLIAESGTAQGFGYDKVGDRVGGWWNVSARLGCGGVEGADLGASVECVRGRPWGDVLAATAMDDGDGSPLGGGAFAPSVDGETVFSDYDVRGAAGRFIKAPLLIGTTNNESGLFALPSLATGSPLPPKFWSLFNLNIFTCPAATTASYRSAAGVPVWRYRWFGDYENTRLYEGVGAWHGSEISVVFGTTGDVSGYQDGAEEGVVGRYLRGAWAGFAKNPAGGLGGLGWPVYVKSRATLVQLGKPGETTASFARPAVYDTGCALLN